jgi:hypothetical protein
VRDKLPSHSEMVSLWSAFLAQLARRLATDPQCDEFLQVTFRSALAGTSTLTCRAVRITDPETRILLSGSR